MKILKKSGCGQRVILHCIKVGDVAERLAKLMRSKGIEVNEELVKSAALLHDIGRSKTHGVEHGVLGGELLKKLGLPEDLQRAVERHVGGGIGKEEAELLKLGKKELIPEKIEEKIVCYADKLVDGAEEIPFESTLEYFKEKFGEDHPVIERLEKLHQFFTEIL
ncbi:MAG: HDIG domain-containing metalloprotein [Thermoproteota archaeon]